MWRSPRLGDCCFDIKLGAINNAAKKDTLAGNYRSVKADVIVDFVSQLQAPSTKQTHPKLP